MGCCCSVEAQSEGPIPPYDLFVLGGQHWDNDSALGTVELCGATTSKRFDNVPSLMQRKYHLSSALLEQADGTLELIALGGKQPGQDGGDELKTMERLSIERDGRGVVKSAKWTTGPPMMRARWGHGSVGLRDVIFAFGGTSGDGDVKATHCESFRSSRGTWIEIDSMQTPRVLHTNTASATGDWVFAVGGHSTAAKRSGERYDVASDRWLGGTFKLACDRFFHASTFAANALFVFGGTLESGAEAERYDMREGTKSAKLPKMPQRRSHFGAVTLPNDNSIVLFGAQGRTEHNVSGDIYDVRAGRYQTSIFPPMVVHRHAFAYQLVE